jgi:putative transposase
VKKWRRIGERAALVWSVSPAAKKPDPMSLTWPPPWLRAVSRSEASGRSGQPMAWPPPWVEARGASQSAVADYVSTQEAEAEAAVEPSVDVSGSAGDGPIRELLDSEEHAILELVEEWAAIDRTYRKLAYRGSYTGRVFVTATTFRRAVRKHRIRLPGEPPKPVRRIFEIPPVPWERNRIWMWESASFPAVDRVAYALVDVVTRYWLCFRLAVGEPEVQVERLFAAALEQQKVLGDGHARAPGQAPILVSWSDAAPEPHGADGPTEQVAVESLFSLIIGEWPELANSPGREALKHELMRIRTDYNEVRLHASIGYVTPADEHEGRGVQIRSQRQAGLRDARLRRRAKPG